MHITIMIMITCEKVFSMRINYEADQYEDLEDDDDIDDDEDEDENKDEDEVDLM